LIAIPDGLDAESRRVVEYVNQEIARWKADNREEPIDVILAAAQERMRRAGVRLLTTPRCRSVRAVKRTR
jgi:hypothetical protein